MSPITGTEDSLGSQPLELLTTLELLEVINDQDATVHQSVRKSISQITALVDACYVSVKAGGKLFYIGSGTSGRLGILDASECPPTFGVPANLVNGIIAGGDNAIRQAQEGAEDNTTSAWKDLLDNGFRSGDVVIGISASGSTPYVLGGIMDAKKQGAITGCIVCNSNSTITKESQYPIEVITGPEVVRGSTRMKAGTAQKLVLNMISTALMVKLGKVQGDRMTHMQLSNVKLIGRGTRMLMDLYGWDDAHAKAQLLLHGSVHKVTILNPIP